MKPPINEGLFRTKIRGNLYDTASEAIEVYFRSKQRFKSL